MTKPQMLILVSELTNLRHSFTELLARKLTLDMELTLNPELEHDPDIIQIREGMRKADKELSQQILDIKRRIDAGFKSRFVSKVSFGEIIPRKPPEEPDDEEAKPVSKADAPVLFHVN